VRCSFAPDSFDAVTAVTVLCFMRDPVAALKELARVVRPGGRVVVGELTRWSAWALQCRLAARRHGVAVDCAGSSEFTAGDCGTGHRAVRLATRVAALGRAWQ
jgi:SAM-dependent methyltransferase